MNVRLVVVGASTGGLEALESLLAKLPPDFPAAIAIAQHRSPDAKSGLCQLLNHHSALPVHEPDDKQPMRPGNVYLAPPDYHMLVGMDDVVLSVDAPVSWARPSIDVLFESAAYAYGPAVAAVVLTGASDDGAEGAFQVHAAGGKVLVQEPDEARSPVLPRAVLKRVAAEVLPLSAMAGRLTSICEVKRSRRP